MTITIDVHAHALSERFLHDLQNTSIAGLTSLSDGRGGYFIQRPGEEPHSLDPNLHNLERRLESLHRRKVALQLFGPSPGFLSWQNGATSAELARALHAAAKEISHESGGVMEGMAIPALGEPKIIESELERAVGEYGFRSIMIPSSVAGRGLDEEAYAPLFAFIERHQMLAFMHPTSAFPTDRFVINGMNVLLGWPFETTLAVTRLLFSGVLHRHPDLKLVLAHGGGNIVYLRGRLNAAFEATGWEAHPYYRAHIDRQPTDYLDRLYYDTCTLSPESSRFLVDTMGSDRVVFGSDYPFDVGDPEGVAALRFIETLPLETREKLLYQNAQLLLSHAD